MDEIGGLSRGQIVAGAVVVASSLEGLQVPLPLDVGAAAVADGDGDGDGEHWRQLAVAKTHFS